MAGSTFCNSEMIRQIAILGCGGEAGLAAIGWRMSVGP